MLLPEFQYGQHCYRIKLKKEKKPTFVIWIAIFIFLNIKISFPPKFSRKKIPKESFCIISFQVLHLFSLLLTCKTFFTFMTMQLQQCYTSYKYYIYIYKYFIYKLKIGDKHQFFHTKIFSLFNWNMYDNQWRY